MSEPEKTAAESDPAEDKDALLKEASLNLRKAHRRIEAEKLAFVLVEKGKIPAFSSYETFHEKLAEILGKDLAVVKEAIELEAPIADFGKVADEQGAPGADASVATFFHTLAE